VEIYGTAEQATGDLIRRTHCECWIPKATNIHSEYVTHIAFPRHCSRDRVIPTLPILLLTNEVKHLLRNEKSFSAG
jgi:hypothetical protein